MLDDSQAKSSMSAAPDTISVDQLRKLPLLDSIIAAPLELQEEPGSLQRIKIYSSRIVAIKLKDGTTFHVHSSLLCRQSERFKRSLKGNFQEGEMLVIEIDEPADHFSCFVDYLYQPRWTMPFTIEEANAPLVAKLYALGDRLISLRFQELTMVRFMKLYEIGITNDDVTILLKIAALKIPERTDPEDPMRETIFSIAASRLEALRTTSAFIGMLDECDGLAKELCLRTKDGEKFSVSKCRKLMFEYVIKQKSIQSS